MYVCMHVLHLCTCVCTCVYMYVCVYACITSMYMCMHMCIHACCMYVCMHVYTYIYIHCVCACTCIMYVACMHVLHACMSKCRLQVHSVLCTLYPGVVGWVGVLLLGLYLQIFDFRVVLHGVQVSPHNDHRTAWGSKLHRDKQIISQRESYVQAIMCFTMITWLPGARSYTETESYVQAIMCFSRITWLPKARSNTEIRKSYPSYIHRENHTSNHVLHNDHMTAGSSKL